MFDCVCNLLIIVELYFGNSFVNIKEPVEKINKNFRLKITFFFFFFLLTFSCFFVVRHIVK